MKNSPHQTTPLGGRPFPLVLLVLLALAPTAQGETELNDIELTESSGVCVGKSGLIWTHNDSGGKPIVYGFSQTGVFVAKLKIENAAAMDWEDICCFSVAGESFLAIADVGDNLTQRKSVQIYVVREPKRAALAKAAKTEVSTALVATLDVKYAAGPVNCESIAFDPRRKTFLLPSKETTRCRLFEIDASKLSGKVDAIATSTQSFFFPLATGCDIRRDGSLLVLCSYGPGCLLKRDASSDQWNTKAQKLFLLPSRKQGEAVGFSLNGKTLFLTSEFAPTPLLSMACPTTVPSAATRAGK